MCSVIKIGSRESLLAVRQAEIIRDLIISSNPEIAVEIVTMKTTGDKILDKRIRTGDRQRRRAAGRRAKDKYAFGAYFQNDKRMFYF